MVIPTVGTKHIMGGAVYDLGAPIEGLDLSKPPRSLDYRAGSDSLGIRMKSDILGFPPGRTAFGSTLVGSLQILHLYMRFTGATVPLALTTDRLYKWSSGDWAAVYQTYTEGTVTCAGGTTVTGSGTQEWLTEARAGDPITIVTTDYVIDSITTDTVLELTTNGPSAGGLAYSIENHLAGDLSKPATHCFGQDLWLFANGVDWIKKYTGSTGALATLTGGDTYQATDVYHKSRVIRHFAGSVMLLNTIEDGVACPQRYRWSDIGELETWTNASFGDLADTPGHIVGGELLGDSVLVAYKDDCIVYLQPVGGGLWGFQPTNAAMGIGLIATNALLRVGDAHIFFGESIGEGIDVFLNVGGSIFSVGKSIRSELRRTLNRTYQARSWMFWDPIEERIFLFHPTTESDYPIGVWVYETEGRGLDKGRWWRDSFIATCGGLISRQSTITYGDLDGTYGAQQWKYGDASMSAGGNMGVIGNQSGEVLELDITSITDEDGATIPETFISKALCYRDIGGISGTLVRCLGVEIVGSGESVNISYSINEGRNWTLVETLTLTEEMERHQSDFDITAESVMIKLESLSTTGRFRLEQWFARLTSRGRR